jgi:hypothetical protein
LRTPVHKRRYPKGYVELLENQRLRLLAGLRKTCHLLNSACLWPATASMVIDETTDIHSLLSMLDIVDPIMDDSAQSERLCDNCGHSPAYAQIVPGIVPPEDDDATFGSKHTPGESSQSSRQSLESTIRYGKVNCLDKSAVTGAFGNVSSNNTSSTLADTTQGQGDPPSSHCRPSAEASPYATLHLLGSAEDALPESAVYHRRGTCSNVAFSTFENLEIPCLDLPTSEATSCNRIPLVGSRSPCLGYGYLADRADMTIDHGMPGKVWPTLTLPSRCDLLTDGGVGMTTIYNQTGDNYLGF